MAGLRVAAAGLSPRIGCRVATRGHQVSGRSFRAHRAAASSVEWPTAVAGDSALDLSNPRIAFQASSSFELARGVAVLTLCSQPFLVRNAEVMLLFSRRLLGQPLTERLLKHTIFAHFVAGETSEEIKPLLARLHGCGVGGILDYAAEADLSSDASQSAAPEEVVAVTNQPARVFEYQSEAQCDANKQTFLRCITAVCDATPEGFAAVKVTALGDPQLLVRTSVALRELQRFFAALDADGDGALSRDEFVRGWREAFLPPSAGDDSGLVEAHARFDAIDTQSDGQIDALEWTQSLPLEALSGLVQQCRLPGPLYHASLSSEEVEALKRMLARLDAIAACAKQHGVRLMIDAERAQLPVTRRATPPP